VHVRDLLAKTGVPVTRIARGIPAGASIRHVQKTILTDALSGRRPLSDR
jgi:recombinational DNA repair protein RecR